jgi:hypothetical protein
MKLLKVVWVTTRFAAFHRWSDAPQSVAFLREYHRHCFHVKMGVKVGHNDREVEFFTLQGQLGTYIAVHFANKMFTYSCEDIAEQILRRFDAVYVTVSEDGENGATIFNDEAI